MGEASIDGWSIHIAQIMHLLKIPIEATAISISWICLYSQLLHQRHLWKHCHHLRSNLVPKSLNHILAHLNFNSYFFLLSPFELFTASQPFPTSFQLQLLRIVPLTRCKAHLLVVVRPMLQPSKTTASWQQFQPSKWLGCLHRGEPGSPSWRAMNYMELPRGLSCDILYRGVWCIFHEVCFFGLNFCFFSSLNRS